MKGSEFVYCRCKRDERWNCKKCKGTKRCPRTFPFKKHRLMEQPVNRAEFTYCRCKGHWNCKKCNGTAWRPRTVPFKKRRPKRFKNNGLPLEERERDHGLWVKYGISLAAFKQRLADQGNVCACCGTDTPDARGWFVDHIRSPGEVETGYRTVTKHGPAEIRGIVCGRCNAAAGLIEAVGIEVVLKFLKWSCPQCDHTGSDKHS